MSKYIYVDGDDGRIAVYSKKKDWGIGWGYKVPSDFAINLTAEMMNGRISIRELLEEDERCKLIHQF